MDDEEELPGVERLFPQGKCANSRQTLRVALNLKALIDQVIPTVFPEKDITDSHSLILNRTVIDLAYRAAGGIGDGKQGTSSYQYRSCLVFALLKVTGWYWQQADYELSDNKLYSLRAVAAQTLASVIIEEATDDEVLFLAVLCHRYQIRACEEDSAPVSALELAVDMNSTIIIGSLGYQRCIKWLWRGWIVQCSEDPHSYVLYKGVASSQVRTHFDPERIKTPAYQNKLEIIVSVFYLALYTVVLNTNQVATEPVDIFEGTFYVFTVGTILDEIVKFYHVGTNYIGFWNVFNDTMHGIITVAIGLRVASLTAQGPLRDQYDEMSFRIMSCAAPLMWSRLLLYLDAQQFVGAMLVVVKTMMKESLLFFVLFAVVILGFLQGFLGLDASDGRSQTTKMILVSLVNAVIGEAGLKDVQDLVPPYASILYYIYSFVLTVILMNILIALYSTSYAAIVENATNEYFALVAQKTLRYIRAPDSNLYVPPFNLVELCVMPLSFVLSERNYKLVNHYMMLLIYLPMLVYITIDELSNARRIQYNRFKGMPDDANEINTEWDLTDGFDDDGSGWEGIRNRNIEISQVVREQRAAEAEDPEFSIDLDKFHRDIQKLIQPVMKANELGIKWELFELYDRIDRLTTLVTAVVEENKELRENAAQKAIMP